MNQSEAIKERLNYWLDRGLENKDDIYSNIVKELEVPRPTVRRVARELRNEILQKIEILQNDWTKVARNLK